MSTMTTLSIVVVPVNAITYHSGGKCPLANQITGVMTARSMTVAMPATAGHRAGGRIK